MPENPFAPELTLASDASILVSVGAAVSPETTLAVRRVVALLRSSPPFEVLDLQPAYASVLVRFDPLRTPPRDALERIREALGESPRLVLPEPRLLEVPVTYGGAPGPDLEEVACRAGISELEAAEIHAAGDYRVAFIGFTPGFPYLTGLDPKIATPRLATPRKRVPAGSVAIGGTQTGIYPLATPGGWRLIGRTPLVLFDPRREQASLLRIGDRVRFVPLHSPATGRT